MICSHIVLSQWFATLVDTYGDILSQKLEVIQLEFDSLGFIGKRHVIQRWEETSEEKDTLNILAKVGGYIKSDD